MTNLPDVSIGDLHVSAHNTERQRINETRNLLDTHLLDSNAHAQYLKIVDADSDLLKKIDAHALLSYVENVSGQGTQGTTGVNWAGIPGVVLNVPPTDRDVWLFWQANVGVSAGGQGTFTIAPWEITNFSETFLLTVGPGHTATRFWSNTIITTAADRHHGFCSIGHSEEDRQFMLACHTIQEGSGLTSYVTNQASSLKTSFAAVMM